VQTWSSWKFVHWESSYSKRANGQADMTKLIVDFRHFAKSKWRRINIKSRPSSIDFSRLVVVVGKYSFPSSRSSAMTLSQFSVRQESASKEPQTLKHLWFRRCNSWFVRKFPKPRRLQVAKLMLLHYAALIFFCPKFRLVKKMTWQK